MLAPLQVVVSGLGRHFCVGIDLQYLHAMFQKLQQVSCPGRMREQFRRHILKMQASDSSSSSFPEPAVAVTNSQKPVASSISPEAQQP